MPPLSTFGHVRLVLSHLGFDAAATCSSFVSADGASVPYYEASGVCAFRASPGAFDCAATSAEAYRICYCSEMLPPSPCSFQRARSN